MQCFLLFILLNKTLIYLDDPGCNSQTFSELPCQLSGDQGDDFGGINFE